MAPLGPRKLRVFIKLYSTVEFETKLGSSKHSSNPRLDKIERLWYFQKIIFYLEPKAIKTQSLMISSHRRGRYEVDTKTISIKMCYSM